MMDFLEAIIQRNHSFASSDSSTDLKIIPTKKTILVGCLDPRVDPTEVLGLEPGEAAIIRNIGGRFNPALLETLVLLPTVAKAAGQEIGIGWNLIILHHTDCGINGCLKFAPDLLAAHLGVERSALDSMSITDPRKAVAFDVAAYKATRELPGGFLISGLVYDVSTRKVEIVVSPSLLRSDT